MSVIYTTVAYAVFVAWALASVSAIGMWAWLSITQDADGDRFGATRGLTRAARRAPWRGGGQKVTS